MNPLLKKSACELADLLRSGEITSVELTQACLDRIDAIDPKVHAFLYVDREGALATAADVDAGKNCLAWLACPSRSMTTW